MGTAKAKGRKRGIADGTIRLGRRVLRGYARIFRGATLMLMMLALTALISVGVAFPLWYIAVHHRFIYTLSVAVLAVVLAVVFLVVRIREAMRRSETSLAARALRALGRAAVAVVFTASLYGLVWLFARGLYLAAVPAALLYVMFLGMVRFGRKREAASN